MKNKNIGPRKITRSVLEKDSKLDASRARRLKESKLLAGNKKKKYEEEDEKTAKKRRDLAAKLSAKAGKEGKEKKLKRGSKELLLLATGKGDPKTRAALKKKREREQFLERGDLRDLAKKKKKKKAKESKSRELALTKSEITAVRKNFGDQSEKIIEFLEVGNSDSAIQLLKKSLLTTVIRILPEAERILVESGTSRGTYQFVTLVSQIRELMSDIQADRDRQYIATSIMENIVRPIFMDIAQEMITEHHAFRKGAERLIVPGRDREFADELRATAEGLARFMNAQYKELQTKITEALKN